MIYLLVAAIVLSLVLDDGSVLVPLLIVGGIVWSMGGM